MLVLGGHWDRGLVTSLDCLVFAAGCVEDPNPAKSSKSPKAEVTHWEELAFCGYKRVKSDRKFFSKCSYTCENTDTNKCKASKN